MHTYTYVRGMGGIIARWWQYSNAGAKMKKKKKKKKSALRA